LGFVFGGKIFQFFLFSPALFFVTCFPSPVVVSLFFGSKCFFCFDGLAQTTPHPATPNPTSFFTQNFCKNTPPVFFFFFFVLSVVFFFSPLSSFYELVGWGHQQPPKPRVSQVLTKKKKIKNNKKKNKTHHQANQPPPPKNTTKQTQVGTFFFPHPKKPHNTPSFSVGKNS